jgi:hypothetical protein
MSIYSADKQNKTYGQKRTTMSSMEYASPEKKQNPMRRSASGLIKGNIKEYKVMLSTSVSDFDPLESRLELQSYLMKIMI